MLEASLVSICEKDFFSISRKPLNEDRHRSSNNIYIKHDGAFKHNDVVNNEDDDTIRNKCHFIQSIFIIHLFRIVD